MPMQNTEDYHLLTRTDYDAEYSPIDNVAATAHALSIEDNPEWLSVWVHRTDSARYVAMFFRSTAPDALTPVAYWRHPHNPANSPVTGDRTTLADGVRIVTSAGNGRVHYWRYTDPITAVYTSATLTLWRALHHREMAGACGPGEAGPSALAPTPTESKLKIYKTQLIWIVDYGHRITTHHTWTAALNEALYNLETLRHAN